VILLATVDALGQREADWHTGRNSGVVPANWRGRGPVARRARCKRDCDQVSCYPLRPDRARARRSGRRRDRREACAMMNAVRREGASAARARSPLVPMSPSSSPLEDQDRGSASRARRGTSWRCPDERRDARRPAASRTVLEAFDNSSARRRGRDSLPPARRAAKAMFSRRCLRQEPLRDIPSWRAATTARRRAGRRRHLMPLVV